MNVRRPLRALILLSGLGLGAMATYEGYAVWRAESRTKQIIATTLSKPQSIRIADLSPEQKDILLKVEDPAFYDHNGVDLSSPGQGMTTITQALVKFLYFDPFKPGFAKIEQSLIARLVLNRHLTKDQQLTIFVNQAYFGEHASKKIRGFENASRVHFGKPFSQLGTDEYIGLVGMLIGPNKLRPDKYQDAYRERVARIEMLLAGGCQPTGVLDAWYKECSIR